MLTLLAQSLRREYRNHRMARFGVWVVAYGAALRVVDLLTAGAPGLLWFLFWIAVIPVGFHYFLRLIRYIRQRVLWRLRRRLIVAYLFIAVVPILLILLLAGIGGYIINVQFASFLVALKVHDHVDQLQELARVVAHEAHLTTQPSAAGQIDHLRKFFVNELRREHSAEYPGLEVTLLVSREASAFRMDGKPIDKAVAVPEWLSQKEFAGIVHDRDRIQLRALDRTPTAAGELTVILSQPITPELLDLVGADVGPVGVALPKSGTEKGASAASSSQDTFTFDMGESGKVSFVSGVHSKSLQLPPATSRLDLMVVGASALDASVWGGNEQRHESTACLVYVNSRITTLNRQLLATLGQLSRVYVAAFLVVAVIFLVIELFALVVGVQLTRSITGTVDKLHDATERVKVGDFSHRIAMPAHDQLSALGEAFDGMTASVQRLLLESQEKAKLEGELQIAREVQAQLFPQGPPEVPGLRLYAACHAARTVSGDYYDFLRLEQNRVGLVVGDISGKGISAALLMAAIQSALHAQFYDDHAARDLHDASPLSTAEVVGRLNRQLFASTPREKYATFFYAVYDPAGRRLVYTTAGHPPPFVFRRGGAVERLGAGGTVVGLFGLVNFDQATVQLAPGDLLLAFTDGITEPENTFGEEFGEDRLVAVVQHALNSPPEALADEIYRSVNDWTGTEELFDDMTLMLAQAVP
ncbi:MAG: PP2C family protein-serine/threonine phosphatase [Terriglobia bacterium]